MSRPDGRIEIVYGAVENKRGGWRPVATVNGKNLVDEYWPHGLSQHDAEEWAKYCAEEEAGRFTGDWDISIEKA